MKFVDRVEEQKRLNKALNAEKPAFVAIFGRRRLGKSTLIKRVLTDSDVYYLADQTEQHHQIQQLASIISFKLPDFDKLVYPDWDALFSALTYRTRQRFTLCLDEFPYLVKSSQELPSVLQKWIDHRALPFNLIVCGSSQQMMQGLVLEGSAPLFGRADQIMKLSPIRIPYFQEALHADAIHAIEEFSVWGGVPRYWELRLSEDTLHEAIAFHVLNPLGTLYDEPVRLFMDDMRDIVQAATLLSVIGNGVHRMSEIAGRLGKPATNLSGPLEKLRILDFIEKDIPFGENPKSSKKSLYKISDSFMDFYFRFVIPNRSLLELGRTDVVMRMVEQHFAAHVAGWWERLCRQAVSGQIVRGEVYQSANRWWGSVARDELIELDVVAESMDGRKLLVGECKWTESEDADRLLYELLEKVNRLPWAKRYDIVPVLFLKHPPVAGSSEQVLLPQNVIDLCG